MTKKVAIVRAASLIAILCVAALAQEPPRRIGSIDFYGLNLEQISCSRKFVPKHWCHCSSRRAGAADMLTTPESCSRELQALTKNVQINWDTPTTSTKY